MKSIGYYSVLCIILCLFITSCTEYTPSGVAAQIAESIRTGDYTKGLTLVATVSGATDSQKKNSQAEFISYLRMKREKDFSRFGGIKTFRIMGEMVTPDESQAIIRIHYTFYNNTSKDELMLLIKSGGRWKFFLYRQNHMLTVTCPSVQRILN